MLSGYLCWGDNRSSPKEAFTLYLSSAPLTDSKKVYAVCLLWWQQSNKPTNTNWQISLFCQFQISAEDANLPSNLTNRARWFLCIHLFILLLWLNFVAKVLPIDAAFGASTHCHLLYSDWLATAGQRIRLLGRETDDYGAITSTLSACMFYTHSQISPDTRQALWPSTTTSTTILHHHQLWRAADRLIDFPLSSRGLLANLSGKCYYYLIKRCLNDERRKKNLKYLLNLIIKSTGRRRGGMTDNKSQYLHTKCAAVEHNNGHHTATKVTVSYRPQQQHFFVVH